ncbi:MAG: type II secretion system protein GspH [Deltaproteobacteria bacterium]|nr:MAG: type II secretion system protein GspH [Deltaproteobacteria bacterium]
MMDDGVKKCAGFTLVELLLVLVILGLVTGIAVPRFSGSLVTVKVKGAAQRTAAILRYARDLAISNQGVCEVRFDPEQAMLAVAVPKKVSRDAGLGQQDDRSAEVVRTRKYRLPDAVEMTVLRDGRGRKKARDEGLVISFFPLGNCSGGTVTLAAKKKGGYLVTASFPGGGIDVRPE